MYKYGAIRIERSVSRTASNSSLLSRLRSAVSMGKSRAWMKFIATYIPSKDPIGLNDWAKFKRRVADSSGPIDNIYGLALVSKNDNPHVSIK